jgi:hypothetical protein
VAAVTSYSSLKTAIADWLARSDLTEFIDQFVQNFEEDFLREPKNFGRWMESELSETIASSVIAVPTGYLAMKYAYIDTSPTQKLDRMSLNQLIGTYPRSGETGLPKKFARQVENFIFGPAPDSDYDVAGVYWAKPTLLRNATADAADHWLIVNAPDIVLYGSLIAAEPFLQNEKRLALWQTMYDRAVMSYRNLNRDEDVSGSPVQEVLG